MRTHPIASTPSLSRSVQQEVRIPAGSITLAGELDIPAGCVGVVLFAHDHGSSRHSPRDRAVASALRGAGLATLLFDLRTPQEESLDRVLGWLDPDPSPTAQRLCHATAWVSQLPLLSTSRVGYFGSGSGAATALLAASTLCSRITAVVCRGGRPDQVEDHLNAVRAATLLLVGDQDAQALERNREALHQLGGEKELAVIQGATHMFREQDELEEVANLATTWFRGFLAQSYEVH